MDLILISRVKELKIKDSKIQSLQHYIFETESELDGYFDDSLTYRTTDTIKIELDTLKVAYLTSEWVDNVVTYNPSKILEVLCSKDKKFAGVNLTLSS